MPLALEVTLILVLTSLSVGLVPLLFQLRRTAQGLDVFLLSSRKDLAQIAEDVHASRVRMDLLAVSLQASLDEVSAFAQMTGKVGSTLEKFHTRFQNTIESASQNLGGILGGVGAVLAFFKRKPTKNESDPEQ